MTFILKIHRIRLAKTYIIAYFYPILYYSLALAMFYYKLKKTIILKNNYVKNIERNDIDGKKTKT